MKTTSARALFAATAGFGALFALPSVGFAQSQEQLTNSVRCQIPFVTSRAPNTMLLQQCVEQMRAKGQVTGIEVQSAPMGTAHSRSSRAALERASAVAARLALEFPSTVVNTLAPTSSTSASSASATAEMNASSATMRYGMVDVVGYVTGPAAQAAVEPAPVAEPVTVLVPTVPEFDATPRRVNPNPGEDFGIGRLDSTVDPDEDREVVDDYKYRDGFLNGPMNPDYGITVNIDDTPI